MNLFYSLKFGSHELNTQSVRLVSGEVAQGYHAGLKIRQEGLAGMGSNPTTSWSPLFFIPLYRNVIISLTFEAKGLLSIFRGEAYKLSLEYLVVGRVEGQFQPLCE